MLKLSKREDYSLLLVHKLLENYKKRTSSLSQIAKEYHISLLFLRNIAGELRKKGILKANEGKNGGYFLALNPRKVKIGDVLSVFSKKPMIECLTLKNNKRCPAENFCRPRIIWNRVNNDFLEKIYNLNLEDFFNYKV